MSWMLRKNKFVLRASLTADVMAMWMTPTFASQIAVRSYTINTPNEPSFPDDTGIQLTDGGFGPVAINSGTDGIPWVGWISTNTMLMTYNFASAQAVDSVQIDFPNEGGIFTFLPDSVTINGQNFLVASNAIPDPSRGFITFNASPELNTQTVTVQLNCAGSGFHVLIDEVQFFGGEAAPSPTPEPAAQRWPA